MDREEALKREAEINREIEALHTDIHAIVPPGTAPLTSEAMEPVHLSQQDLTRYEALTRELEKLEEERIRLRADWFQGDS